MWPLVMGPTSRNAIVFSSSYILCDGMMPSMSLQKIQSGLCGVVIF